MKGEEYGLISRPGGQVGLKANRGALPRATCQLGIMDVYELTLVKCERVENKRSHSG
jgi:hypothetical protein